MASVLKSMSMEVCRNWETTPFGPHVAGAVLSATAGAEENTSDGVHPWKVIQAVLVTCADAFVTIPSQGQDAILAESMILWHLSS